MTDDDVSHWCRSGDTCVGRKQGPDSGEWIPAVTERPNTLCEPGAVEEPPAGGRHRRRVRRRKEPAAEKPGRSGCMGRLERAVAALDDDLDDLCDVWLDPSAGTGVTGGRRGAEPKGSPALVNVHADALFGEIKDAVERCAQVITDAQRAPMPDRWRGWLDCVAANLDVLVQAPPAEHMTWNRAGDEWRHTVLDGPDLAMQLVELHRRARALAGVSRGRDRMPVPCPICEAAELGRWHGRSTVDCLSCRARWTEQDYRRLTLIVADDLAAAHVRPKPREHHLSRSYATQPEATKGRRL